MANGDHKHEAHCEWPPWEYDRCNGAPVKRTTPLGWVSFESVPPPRVGDCVHTNSTRLACAEVKCSPNSLSDREG